MNHYNLTSGHLCCKEAPPTCGCALEERFSCCKAEKGDPKCPCTAPPPIDECGCGCGCGCNPFPPVPPCPYLLPPVITTPVFGTTISPTSSFTVSGTAGPHNPVAVCVGELCSTVSADHFGNWSYLYSGPTLAVGPLTITAYQTDSCGQVSETVSVIITVESTGT